MSTDVFRLGDVVNGMTWLDEAGKVRVTEFVINACPGMEWGAAELATLLVAGLGLLREDPEDPFAIALLHVSEEMARAMLTVLS